MPDKLPAEILQPQQIVDLHVTISPPSFCEKVSELTIKTDQADSPRIQIPVRMTGRKLVPPYLYGGLHHGFNTTLRPGQEWSDEFEIWSVESVAKKPWLTGFVSDAMEVSIEQPVVDLTATLFGNTVRRKYKVSLNAGPPNDGTTILRTTLKARTQSKPSRPSPPISLHLQWKSSLSVSPSIL